MAATGPVLRTGCLPVPARCVVSLPGRLGVEEPGLAVAVPNPDASRTGERLLHRGHVHFLTGQQLGDGQDLDPWEVASPSRRAIRARLDRLPPHGPGGRFQRDQDAHRGLLPVEGADQIAHRGARNVAALDLDQAPLQGAGVVIDEGDHPVDAPVGPLLLPPLDRLGPDERECPPLELVAVRLGQHPGAAHVAGSPRTTNRASGKASVIR